jgi:release factor glutamine methyltransferase
MILLAADQQKQKKWTVLELLNWTADYLSKKGFEDARLNGERMLGYTLGLSRIELYTNFDRPLVPDELTAFKSFLKRRLTHEPLQYILGETEFYSLSFKVTPNVLIPRPETELLVDKVIECCNQVFAEREEIHVLDVGCGSGCIGVALAQNVRRVVMTAVDISPEALVVAQGNAVVHDAEIRFRQLDAVKPWPTEYLAAFDIVVSNPPYVSFPEYQDLQPEIREFEPKVSLLGGNDGLDFYKKFANICPTLLKPQGYAFFEIGERQAASVKNIYADAGFTGFSLFDDLAGRNRVIKMQWNRSRE